jgi:hypothetical protein
MFLMNLYITMFLLLLLLKYFKELQHALYCGAAAGQAGCSHQLSCLVFSSTLPYCMQQQ